MKDQVYFEVRKPREAIGARVIKVTAENNQVVSRKVYATCPNPQTANRIARLLTVDSYPNPY